MDFSHIKAAAQYALNADALSQNERDAVRAAILSDTNKQRATLLMEALGFQRSKIAEG